MALARWIAPLLAVAIGAAGCGGGDSSTTSSSSSTVTGTRTQLNAAPALAHTGVTMAPVAPANGGAASVSLPITGGELDFNSGKGTIELGGGLRYTVHGKSATLTDIVIDTDSDELKAKVGGDETTLMNVKSSSIQALGGKLAQDIALTLTDDGAEKLGEALGVDFLKEGLTMSNGVIQATSS